MMPTTSKNCILGVDVGGTNTDAVLLNGSTVVSSYKHPTTPDVTSGLMGAVYHCLCDAKASGNDILLQQVNIGTTHFVNAVVQRSSSLSRVAVIRLATPPCGQANPPFFDFPGELRKIINGGHVFVSGGYEVDGREIAKIEKNEVLAAVNKFYLKGIRNIAVIGIFSPLLADQENAVERLIEANFPDMSVTLSHNLGRIGFLERENATILNESLRTLCHRTVSNLKTSLEQLSLKCPLYLTQNDGTICSADLAMKYPIFTFASGPTNSMRGAAFISGIKDGLVIDIGGTSTDVGVLVNGFPRQAGSELLIGGVRTNFRMPDTVSIGLGGGSIVRIGQNGVAIGPESVGYRLIKESLCFGGDTLTATDIAVAAGWSKDIVGNKATDALAGSLVESVCHRIQEIVEEAVDRMKTSSDALPVVFVGGGSILIDPNRCINGCNRVVKCDHSSVANAIGAALCHISGHVDLTYKIDSSDPSSREKGIETAKRKAIAEAVATGANEKFTEILEFEELPVSYLPGNIVQFKATAVGPVTPVHDQAAPVDWHSLKLPKEFAIDHDSDPILPVISNASTKQTQDILRQLPKSRNIDESTGIWTIDDVDVECIGIGAGILGCGGGGNPHVAMVRLRHAMSQGFTPRVLMLDRLKQYAADKRLQIVPIGFMGAPLVLTEKLISGTERELALKVMKLLALGRLKDVTNGRRNTDPSGVIYVTGYESDLPNDDDSSAATIEQLIIPYEIGGMNSTEPIAVGAITGNLCLDGDLMGRAFPELQMLTSYIYGQSPYPTVVTSDNGSFAICIEGPEDAKAVEDCCRAICIEAGGEAGVAMSPIPLERCVDLVIPNSITRAYHLGYEVLLARKEKRSCVDAVVNSETGLIVCVGKIIDVCRRTVGGFNRGRFIVEGLDDFSGRSFLVEFQNENLIISEDGVPLATTPDLICAIETETGLPITTELLHYGLRVSIVIIPPSSLLTTPAALDVIGPKAFGYENQEYRSVFTENATINSTRTDSNWTVVYP